MYLNDDDGNQGLHGIGRKLKRAIKKPRRRAPPLPPPAATPTSGSSAAAPVPRWQPGTLPPGYKGPYLLNLLRPAIVAAVPATGGGGIQRPSHPVDHLDVVGRVTPASPVITPRVPSSGPSRPHPVDHLDDGRAPPDDEFDAPATAPVRWRRRGTPAGLERAASREAAAAVLERPVGVKPPTMPTALPANIGRAPPPEFAAAAPGRAAPAPAGETDIAKVAKVAVPVALAWWLLF